jgi:hypothetical protein
LYKDTASDYLGFAVDNTVFPDQTNDVTLAAWFYVSTTDQNLTLAQTTGNSNDVFRIEQRGQEIRLYDVANDTEVITNSKPISAASTWFHVAVRMDSSSVNSPTMDLFVNGEFIDNMSKVAYGTSGDGEELRFMENMAAGNSERLDLVTVWQRRLANWEVNTLYDNGNGLTASMITSANDGLVPSYPYDFILPKDSDPNLKHFTFGDGFEDGTQLNIGVSTSKHLAWTFQTTQSNKTYYLYVEYDEGSDTLTTGFSRVAPYYSLQPPRNPPNFDVFWYPINHRSRGKEWNGFSWVSKLRLFVGEATTDGSGNFTRDKVHTYAYQGRYVSYPVAGTNADAHISFTHNIGTKLVNSIFIAQYLTDDEEYVAGDEIVLSGTHNSSHATYNKNNGRESAIAYQKEGLANFTKAKGDGTSTNTKWDKLQISLYAIRLF